MYGNGVVETRIAEEPGALSCPTTRVHVSMSGVHVLCARRCRGNAFVISQSLLVSYHEIHVKDHGEHNNVERRS